MVFLAFIEKVSWKLIKILKKNSYMEETNKFNGINIYEISKKISKKINFGEKIVFGESMIIIIKFVKSLRESQKENILTLK